MIIGYGGYTLTFAITGQSGSGAAFLTPSSNMADGRTGTVCALKWTDGTQNTSSYVDITVTISSPLDTVARQGVAGICNVIGLPEGIRVTIGGKVQDLVAGARGELSSWVLPAANGNTMVIKINNNVSATSPIVAGQEFAIGEIFVGRAVSLCTLAQSSPSSDLNDPTAYSRSAGGQLWQLMRKPFRQVGATLGRFTTRQAKGGAESDIPDGGNPADVIDIQTLRGLLATTAVCAVCDTPSAGQGDGSVQDGIRYDQDFMQTNWMLARPSTLGAITLDQWPKWSWPVQFQEAT